MNDNNETRPNFEYGNYAPTLNDWMSNIPVIDNLTLGELILPGAHNTGSDKNGNYILAPATHWAVCQNDSFYYQLINGARAFDVRLEFDINVRNGNNYLHFYFHHNGVRSYRELSQLTQDVSSFLVANPDEFIILDFHKLDRGNRPFNFKEFSDRLVGGLGELIIPLEHSRKTLGELKRISKTQRVLLAADYHPDLDPQAFGRSIQHKWSGSAITDVQYLESFIETVMASPPSSSSPWSLSATAYSVAGGPVSIPKKLNDWFDVNKPWIHKCSIINADFFEESNLVHLCRAANIMKAQSRLK
ncbi:phospholipase [Pseudomonas jessenii]|jgi:1-phosphatidylinositol phosphodiesterase|uniref:Phospholipase n=1 Tax=Pseudomonas jessenii TaxID=77298 RepID=A0A2W0ELQ4_PSEJE|nr:phospholipase [Pseudomonas jessenii]PYY69479.1 phospholipase [Pseudomonas jessenii]